MKKKRAHFHLTKTPSHTSPFHLKRAGYRLLAFALDQAAIVHIDDDESRKESNRPPTAPFALHTVPIQKSGQVDRSHACCCVA